MTNFAHHPFATRVLRASATLTLIVLAVLAIVAAPLASAQTFMFNRADFVTGTGPAVVAVGDFRGNGLMDVVTGNNDTANTVSVLLGKGDGTFQDEGYFAAGSYPLSVAVGDFNGDGMLDIATANNGDDTDSVLLQVSGVLSKTAITFPKTTVGNSASATVKLSNIGTTPFAIRRFTLNGKNASAFSQTHNCGASLPGGTTCSIKIVFQPTSAKKFNGVRLEISDGAVSVPQVVYLQGLGSLQ